ncbi:LacI family transcriptional regulator [Metabacillus litoralis]|uniref:LacI family transcriptional regulator n=1 Tax=Metabacillus litoralis TaxID=152268 RepID=A0A5C6VZR9_9BACI|nr:LacI family DNA-binding transcriptional regulator [Metabacillus litoralis]TXC91078.1 LacI family transcriptional regulator [Metabacillus litoralis]
MQPTIYDIAKKTGFSITTVSKVLNNYPDVSDKTRAKILKTIEEIGYHPNSHARALMTKKYWTIGVVFIEQLDIGIKHPFFNAVIESFRKRVGGFGYDLLLVSKNIENERRSYLERFQHRGVDGVIVVSPQNYDEEVKELVEHEMPSVFIDINSKDVSVVNSDNHYGSILVVDYLYSLGHRKIAHIAGAEETLAGKDRLKGYRDAIAKYQLNLPESYIENGGYFDSVGGQKAMDKLLLLKNRPTAVYVAGDLMALGAMKSIRKHGLKIPEDISIVGYDDIELAVHSTPSLTTIRQNTDLIGAQAADLLLQQINAKKKIPIGMTVPVELIIRESTIDIKKC